MSEIEVNQLLAQLRAMAAAAQGRAPEPAASAGPDFFGLVRQAVNEVNEAQRRAADLAAKFELGDPQVNLADVMVSLQKANVSFQAMTEVRNRLVAAYQEIMNMQV